MMVARNSFVLKAGAQWNRHPAKSGQQRDLPQKVGRGPTAAFHLEAEVKDKPMRSHRGTQLDRSSTAHQPHCLRSHTPPPALSSIQICPN